MITLIAVRVRVCWCNRDGKKAFILSGVQVFVLFGVVWVALRFYGTNREIRKPQTTKKYINIVIYGAGAEGDARRRFHSRCHSAIVGIVVSTCGTTTSNWNGELMKNRPHTWYICIAPPFVFLIRCTLLDWNVSITAPKVYDFLASAGAKYGIGFWKPGSGIIHQVSRAVLCREESYRCTVEPRGLRRSKWHYC